MNYFKYSLFLFFIFLVGCSLFNVDDKQKNSKEMIYIASVSKGLGADSISTTKFHKAMNLAALLSDKYSLIPPFMIDSAYNSLEAEGKSLRAIDIGREVNADKIMFARLNRLHNMLRVDITLFSTDNEEYTKMGKGYELMNYYDLKENKMLLDPSLLKATQRAFADVLNDSLMYDSVDAAHRVYPSPTLVVSGLAYVGMPDSTDWRLYNDRVISSFDACETIFEEVRNSRDYVAYDLETRDSIYAMFNMFGIENYMPPTNIEIESLRKLEVDNFISGKISFKRDSAVIKLMLFEITQSGQNMVKSAEGILNEDKTESFRAVLRKTVNKLME